MTSRPARRALISFLAAAMAAGAAMAQTAPAPVGLPRVALTTEEGVIVLELDADKAPVTARNFLRYVDQRRLDGASFYRANTARGRPDYGLLQGGVQMDPKRVLPPIAHEPTNLTGLSHKDGVVSMGRFAPGTATGDFFICVGDQAYYLDADPKAQPPNAGFAAFGRVIDGMDVVRRIIRMPVSPTAGEGAMKGQMLVRPVRILSARRVS